MPLKVDQAWALFSDTPAYDTGVKVGVSLYACKLDLQPGLLCCECKIVLTNTYIWNKPTKPPSGDGVVLIDYGGGDRSGGSLATL